MKAFSSLSLATVLLLVKLFSSNGFTISPSAVVTTGTRTSAHPFAISRIHITPPLPNPKVSTRLEAWPQRKAAEVVVVAASAALPSIKTLFVTCLLPTLLGLVKYEYGVSYGYGTSTAVSSYLILKSLLTFPTSPLMTLVQLHAAAIIFYGARLNIFLLYRELFVARFRRMRERIESRQTVKEEGSGLLGRIVNRLPFIISCAFLYLGLAIPPLMGGRLLEMMSATHVPCEKAVLAYKALVGCTWMGFLAAALGDFIKTIVKGMKGADHLVTGGLFSLLRHPNYTGEIFGWTSSLVASLVAISMSGVGLKKLKPLAIPYALGVCGTLGIIFVLCAAATNLEARQKEKYGKSDKYNSWSAWAGITFSPKKKSE